MEVSNVIALSSLAWVGETASVLESLRVDVTFRPMDLSTAHLRRALRQRARGFRGIALLVQAVERPHAWVTMRSVIIRTQTPQLAVSGCFGALIWLKFHELTS